MTDFYELLDIPFTSDEGLIRKAYYKLAKLWHPDKNSDKLACSKFHEISLAYKTLSNAQTRKVYDIQLFLDSKGVFSARKKPHTEIKTSFDSKSTFDYIYNLFKRSEQSDFEIRKKRPRNN
jgi:DnaJ-class molecular chaperone